MANSVRCINCGHVEQDHSETFYVADYPELAACPGYNPDPNDPGDNERLNPELNLMDFLNKDRTWEDEDNDFD